MLISQSAFFCIRVLKDRNFKNITYVHRCTEGFKRFFSQDLHWTLFWPFSHSKSLLWFHFSFFLESLCTTCHCCNSYGFMYGYFFWNQIIPDVIITLVALSFINYLHNYIDTYTSLWSWVNSYGRIKREN